MDDKKQKQKIDQKQITKEEFEKLQTEFSNLQELAQRLELQLKRAVADYQNLEKRVVEGRSQLSNWATIELIKKILPVLDHFEKALAGASDQDKESGWYKGVELAFKQLQTALKDEGLEEIETGSQFDPALHEAVDTREGEDNMILEVAEKGYNLGGKVIKPAKVIVGRQSS